MSFIQTACDQIVSPPKFRYSSLDLGAAIMPFGRRYDFDATNKFNKTLKCSLYAPKARHSSQICVIYLHSMNGSRLECLSSVDLLLQKGLFMCSFDFSGCGNSQGEVISFGANEKYDVDIICEQLVRDFGLQTFVLWGRSMGAVAALKYYQLLTQKFSKVQIHGLILDSPFKSLKELIVELGTKRTDMPRIMIKAGFQIIKSTLQRKASFQIEDLELLETMKRIDDIPLIFLVSHGDTTISPSHSQALFDSYPFPCKQLTYFEGLHNESRDEKYMQAVMKFVGERMERAGERKKNVKYKRIQLEESVLKMGKEEIGDGQCRCELFPFTRANRSSA